MSITKLFDSDVLAEILLNKANPIPIAGKFQIPQMQRYIRYLTVEGGLGGFFIN